MKNLLSNEMKMKILRIIQNETSTQSAINLNIPISSLSKMEHETMFFPIATVKAYEKEMEKIEIWYQKILDCYRDVLYNDDIENNKIILDAILKNSR